MGKRKKIELNEIDRFVQRARKLGLRYAQLQVMETCEMLRKQEEKKRRGSEESLFSNTLNGVEHEKQSGSRI